MKSENHKHKGVLTSKGALRPHPITRKHSDPQVQKHHNKALGIDIKEEIKKEIQEEKPTKKADKRVVLVPIDSEGYISVNLDKTDAKGLKVTFSRREGRTYRQAGVKIENEKPTTIGGRNKHIAIDEQR